LRKCEYTDKVSILQVIQASRGVPTISGRVKNLSGQMRSRADNGRAVGDLMSMFHI
jgi:hypothetical protein